MQEKLNKDFLIELFAAAFKPNMSDLFGIVVKEIDMSYLPTETYKYVLKELQISHNTIKRAPTIPVLSQHFSDNLKVLDLLNKISKVDIIDKDSLLKQLETFVKEREFLVNYDDFKDLWNGGKKQEVYDLMLSTANKINTYSLTQNTFTKVLGNFETRHSNRLDNVFEAQMRGKVKKVPYFIDQQDEITKGGMLKGHTYLYCAISGGFKSTALRYHAYQAALAGYKVVHFQAEDNEETTTESYDSALLGSSLYELDHLEIDSKKVKGLVTKLKQNLATGAGEIYLKAFEQFDTATLADCRKYLFDLIRDIGEVDLIVFDYLELFDPSDGQKYKSDDVRGKRIAIANKLKNIAMEFNAVVLTATQMQDVKQNLLDDPEFFLTRNHISEFKGLVKPFSGVHTLNQTTDEYDSGVMRIYNDKFRKLRARQIVKIANAVQVGRFYSKPKTLEKNFFIPKG